MIAKPKEINGFDYDTIRADLSKERHSDVKIIYSIMDFLRTDCVRDTVKELEMDFSHLGNRYYPRLLLLGVLLYCFARKIYKYGDITSQCRENRFLRIFTRGVEPCESTFRNFLNENKSLQFRKIFLATLLQYNEYDLLKFLHCFIDSTDAILRGSKYYKIYKIELKAMGFMAENKLLHNNREKSMKRSYKKLLKILKENPHDEELQVLISIILPRIQIYNHKLYKKIDIFEQAIENSNKDFVSITYPTAQLIPLKSCKWDIAKNLQMAVTDNNIIIGSIFINDPDDSKALEKLIPELHTNFQILADLVEKYGTRNNTKQIKKLLKQSMLICDSAYDTEANIVYIDKNELRSLIMPKITARHINDEMRKKEKELEYLSGEITIIDDNTEENKNNKEDEEKKSTKNDLKIIWNGYMCQFNRPILCYDKVPIDAEVAKGLPEIATVTTYKYACTDCSGCPYQESCKYKYFSEKIKPYSYDSRNKFTQKYYRELYMQRFQKAESVFGYFKGLAGVLHLLGNNDLAISNEMYLRNSIYNIIHLVGMKGTIH